MNRTLLPYQARWVRDRSRVKVVEKSRRIGLSWAEAYDSVMHAGRADGGGNVYYQGYSHDMARTFIEDCADWARALQAGADVIGEVLIEDAGKLPAFRLPLASGHEIVAMTSAARGFRSKGRPGDVAVLDEAAFVDDLEAVLKSAMAFRVWGGAVRIISTHNGDANPFATLVRDVREGERRGSLHTITLRDALNDGLYKRISEVSGEEWSEAAQESWEADLRAEYGQAAEEELDCVPSAGGGAWLPWDAIRRCEHPDAGRPGDAPGGPTFIGVDVARRGDLWALAVLETVADVLWLRELVVERGIPFAQQRAIVRAAVDRHRPARVAVDQTGMGEAFVEQLQDAHGSLVEGVLLTGPKRLDVATALRERVEDTRLRIPRDDALRADLHSIRREGGAGAAAPRLVASGGTDGHADRFWALALAAHAAAQGAAVYAYRPVREAGGVGFLGNLRRRMARRPDHSDDRRRAAGGVFG